MRDDSDFRVDKFIMLFSTDWFYDYWSVLGMAFTPEIKRRFQHGCRRIVRDMIGDAAEYWLIHFSNERVRRTLSLLQDLLIECDVSDVTVGQFLQTIRRREASSGREGDQGLVLQLTELMATGEWSGHELPPLEPTLVAAVTDIWRRYEDNPERWRKLCLNSRSEWDRYVRSLTPDLPDLLADFLTEGILMRDAFNLFWEAIGSELSERQKRDLFAWYASAAKALGCSGFRVP